MRLRQVAEERERALRNELLARPGAPWSDERGELHARGENISFFEGPDLRDPVIRAAVGFLTTTFKVHPFSADNPDIWTASAMPFTLQACPLSS